MAQPQPYNRQFNFADQQALTPSSPLPGVQVDAELNSVKLTLDQTLANLAKVQRDDGALKNGIVTQDSLAPSLSIGFTFRGAWAEGVNYLQSDGASIGSIFYRAKVSHLSTAGNSPAVDTATWEAIANITPIGIDVDSIYTAALQNGAVTSPKLANGAVSEDKIGTGAVATGKLADGVLSANSTGRAKMADGFVTEAKIADDAVTEDKIADEAVTNAKLANMAAGRFKLRKTVSGVGDPEDATAAEATAELNAMVGDAGSGGTKGLAPAPAVGDATAGKFLKADGSWAVPAPRGHIYGLTLANNATDATNDIDIAAGEAASDGAAPFLMVLASTLTKRLDAAWAVGSGNGGLDTGSIANTTYHMWLIQRSDTGVVDALFSASATAPTMPANYDRKAYLWPIIRASGAILGFKQDLDTFQLTAPLAPLDFTDPGPSAATRTLSGIPTGIRVEAHASYYFNNSVASDTLWLSDLSIPDLAPSNSAAPLGDNATGSNASFGMGIKHVMTNTSAQIRSRMRVGTATTTLRICGLGFRVPRR